MPVIKRDGRGNDYIYDDNGNGLGFPSVAGDPNSPPSPVLIPEAQGPGTPYYATGQGGPLPSQGDRTMGGKLGDPSMLRPTPPTGNNIPLNTGSGVQMNGGIGGPNLAAAQSNADRYKLLQMHLAALGGQAYRQPMADARLNALSNQLQAYQPLNQVMQSMYGPRAGFNLQQMAKSPMPPGMSQIGAPNRSDIGLQNPYNQYAGPRGQEASANAQVTYPDASIVALLGGGQ